MAIIEFDANTGPHIARHKGKVAVYHGEEGLLLDPAQATRTAMKMLRAVSDVAGDGAPAFDVEHMHGAIVGGTDGERLARLTFTVHDCELIVVLNDIQTAELATSLAAASKALDRPGQPKRDA